MLTRYRRSPRRPLKQPPDLTILTCNSGSEGMGLLEESCERAGLKVQVCGQGREPWVNSRDKPEALLEGLALVRTPFVLYADSRDAIVVSCLDKALREFREGFDGCRLLFGADRINWPHVRSFKKFEDGIAPPDSAEGFLYLNGGAWIGETEFARGFFEEVLDTEPVAEAADSEQGRLKKLFPKFHPQVQLDYRCRLIQNLGFVLKPLMEEVPCESSSTASSDIA